MAELPDQTTQPDFPDNGAPARTNTLAIIALISTFVFAPAGLICGIIARSQIKVTKEQGDGMALAAIIVSSVIIAIWFFAVILVAALFNHVVTHCLGQVPSTLAPGFHWICAGNNTWISSGG
jgi:ABC-type spermidine/putrescine transport system permease subunit II